MAPAPVALIGFDALEASVLAANPDRYPSFAGMRHAGASGSLAGLEDTMTDTVWPEIRTGMSSIRTGVYYQPRQFRSGDSVAGRLGPDDIRPERFYWNLAASSGLAVCALDQPFAEHRTPQAAVEIEWGSHDRVVAPVPPPDPAAARLVADAGVDPVGACDARNDGTDRARADILARVLEGADRFTALAESLLRVRSWDLFTAVYSGSHCAGHQLWPMHADDPRRPSEIATLDSIERVYRALDAGLGRLLAALDGCTVIAYASHGIRPVDQGPALVSVVLERMGLAPARPRRRRLAALVPAALRHRIARAVGTERLQRAGLTSDTPIDAPGTTAITLPNSGLGAIRLSLAGRDPGGKLAPGSSEHRRIVDDVRREFLDLRLVDGGACPVRDVIETDELLGTDRHPDLPDLLVRFRRDVGFIGACRSPSLGDVDAPRPGHRSGEHGTPGAIWAVGPDVAAGTDLGVVRTVDLAPTVMHLLGFEVPEWMDGAPVIG